MNIGLGRLVAVVFFLFIFIFGSGLDDFFDSGQEFLSLGLSYTLITIFGTTDSQIIVT